MGQSERSFSTRKSTFCRAISGRAIGFVTSPPLWIRLVSGLFSGATVVLYHGSPFYSRHGTEGTMPMPHRDDLSMPKLVDELEVTQSGASAAYSSALERQRLMLSKQFGLSLESLKAIYSTGSSLDPSKFRYIYESCGPRSISAPYMGHGHHLGLRHAVSASAGVCRRNLSCCPRHGHASLESGEPGELVCAQPFPRQSVQFLGPQRSGEVQGGLL
ncbi:hypothetical protein BDW66DRAFT_140574 [Aspergillus desertorum]